MCGRFFVAADDPELMAILKEIEQENKRQGMELPPIKTGMVFPTDYTAAKLSDKNKARIFSKYNGAFHPMMEKVTSLTPELKRFLKNQPSGNQRGKLGI